MSSQKDAGIPVFHAPDGIGYRLMELPPELLAALESSNPPKSVYLHSDYLDSHTPAPSNCLLKLA